MSDTARKMFPVATVLALVAGRQGVDVKDIAGYIAGRSLACDTCAAAVAPFAAAWLAKLCPKFAEFDLKETDDWSDFVKRAAGVLGDKVSLTPLDGALKAAADKALDALIEMHDSVVALKADNAALKAEVEKLTPAHAKAAELQKKCDQLEEKIKGMNADMGGLRRQVAEFNGKVAISSLSYTIDAYRGKVAISHDELMETIKDAIKSNLKNITVAAGAAGAAAGDAAEDAAPAEENSVPDDFGFGSSGANSDGFGF